MKCSKCGYYSRPLLRCKLGKINPPTLKGGAQAMEYFGFNYLCKIDTLNLNRAKKMALIMIKERVKRDKKNTFEDQEPLTTL